MLSVEYIAMDQQGLDHIGALWDKLREHHVSHAKECAFFFSRMSYPQRKEGLLKVAAAGKMRVDLVRDTQSGCYVGYCVTSLSADKKGEIESIYVEQAYRKQGIGNCLMHRALTFLDEHDARRKVLAVAVGNEEAFGFYRRHGFVPRVTLLEQVPAQ
jgi:diamine N-acetyltransferase